MSTHSRPAYTRQFRYEVEAADVARVQRIVASTGFFSENEIQIAIELVNERLTRGAESGYEFVFLLCDQQVVGYACYGLIPCTVASFDLYWIAVDDRYRGRGFGRALLVETEVRIQQAGGLRIYAETSGRPQYEPTRRFYQNCGYHVEAQLVDFYAPGDDKIVFGKIAGSGPPEN